MRESYEETNVGTDPSLVPMDQPPTSFQPPVVVPVAGAVTSVDGMQGPAITFGTGAAVNGIAVAKSSVGNVTTFSITGPGDMAQRNAIAAVLDETTIDAIDPATTMALVNLLKAKINELLTKARAANHLTP